ncbi:hypothetical protein EHS13_09120 [Paenibacillus psychroresistens]|uniref:SGNH hydrolase-type esterase domain-containing protein n=1 Tax=Paenibacillus psychroresistens TaxID=1778678 RepID=A0A6B8RHM2_9BACL|nr:SGNH/GDSL hydrolase family protein [Paenibacillus psychroresistens]QGQ95033.1 hypothetical protein EHS13_09120 [Paenibacillus psychroresistens]
MIYKQTELLNVSELVEVPSRPGVLLQRLPESTKIQLHEQSQIQFKRAACSEIRFVSDWNSVDITLACYGGTGTALLYYGDFQASRYTISEEPSDLKLKLPFPDFLAAIDLSSTSSTFLPTVWRLVLHGAEFHLIDIVGDSIRPPLPHEIPKRKYLAYGTSITYGESATSPDLSYVKQTAWRLGADVINLGASGSAHCEPELADYIAARTDWDFATFCISINMFNQEVPVDIFQVRANYMIHTVASANPNKPVVCIGLLPSFADFGQVWPGRKLCATTNQYREALRHIVEQAKLPNLYYVDGRHLLTRHGGLTSDMLHPGNLGMIEIGENLAKVILPLLNEVQVPH